jgi:hypothetical protein
MHDHQFEGNRHRRFMAMHHHPERIADQQEIDVRIDEAGGMRVIRRQRHDLLLSLPSLDVWSRDSARFGVL